MTVIALLLTYATAAAPHLSHTARQTCEVGKKVLGISCAGGLFDIPGAICAESRCVVAEFYGRNPACCRGAEDHALSLPISVDLNLSSLHLCIACCACSPAVLRNRSHHIGDPLHAWSCRQGGRKLQRAVHRSGLYCLQRRLLHRLVRVGGRAGARFAPLVEQSKRLC